MKNLASQLSMRALLVIFLAATGAVAQTTVTTSGSATSGTVPLFNGSSDIENSVITQANGNISFSYPSFGSFEESLWTNSPSGTGITTGNALCWVNHAITGGPNTAFSSATCTGSPDAYGDSEYDLYLSLGTTIGSEVWKKYMGVTTEYGVPSVLFPGSMAVSGNVGIGTTSPSVPLEVNGSIKMDSGVLVFPDGSTLSSTASLNQLGLNGGGTPAISQQNGNVGIGTTNPDSALTVAGAIDIGSSYSFNNNLYYSSGWKYSGNGSGLTMYSMGGITYFQTAPVNSSGAGAVATLTTDMSFNGGNVGIGTITPGAMLDVAGNIKISGLGANLTFSDGTIQSTAYTGTCPSAGGDYAESVDVEGDRKSYEPGDVIVLASGSSFDVAKSSEPYSTLVAGIYSTRPGYVGRRQITDPKLSSKEIPMAMVGIVPTKVSAENGPIQRGDLLVTASRVGYAMKGTDHTRMMGAVVGKAMGSLGLGTGIIEVLVSLQ